MRLRSLCPILLKEDLVLQQYAYTFSSESRHHEISWSYRSALLAKEFGLIGADVFCLQEVQNDHYEIFFRPTMEKGCIFNS